MPKPRVLHIGDPIKYNHDVYARFASQFDIIRPSTEERARDAFKQALQERRWGDFDAIFRPFWNTGGEMGRWDEELISLLPSSVKIVASAGAGYDWADVDVFAKYGTSICLLLSILILSSLCLSGILIQVGDMNRNPLLQRRRGLLGIRRRHGPTPHPQRIP